MRIIFLSLLLITCIHSSAQPNDAATIKSIYDNVLLKGTAYDNLHFICKKIGARLNGSLNAQKAVTETARMLTIAGADSVYLQPCTVPNWQRGAKEQGYILLANGTKRQLKLCALGASPGTGAKGITAGVIEVKSFKELDQLGETVIKGKIVFFNFPMDPTSIRTYSAYGVSAMARVYGPSKASKYGAIAALVRSVTINKNDHIHTGVTIYNDSFPKIPAVAISTNDADWLSSRLKRKMQLKAFIKTACKTLPDASSFNVIGEIRGTDFPEQIITVGAHLDSWDLAEGAHDDGAGVVQCIDVIRVLKSLGIQPKRTIRVVLFMDEESTGKGSDQYFEKAKAGNEKYIFAVETDYGGFSPRGFTLDMSDEQKNKVLQWKDLFYPYGIYNFDLPGGGADINLLKKIGTAVAGLETDSHRYFDVHHADTDVFENVHKRELHLGAAAIASFAWLVSEYGL